MMNVMVVEDDFMFRYAIKNIIDWSALGLNINGEAINGKHALDVIKDCAPEIVITDISMPEMNGIDLIKILKKDYPAIKIVVLSSYDDFEFVKDALKFGAEDYILKHDLKADNFIELINHIKQQINEEKENEAESNYVKSNLQAIIDSFMSKLLYGEYTDSGIIEQNIRAMHLKISTKNLLVMCIEIEDINFIIQHKGNKDNLRDEVEVLKAVEKVLEDTIEYFGNGSYGKLSTRKYAFVLSFNDEKSEHKINTKVNEVAQHIKNNINRVINRDTSIGISKICYRIEDIHKHYNQAQNALINKLYEGKNQVFFYDTLPVNNLNELIINDSIFEKLTNTIKNGDEKELNKILRNFFNTLSMKRLNEVELKKVFLELYSYIYIISKEFKMDFYEVTGSKNIIIEILEEIDSIQKVEDFFLQCFLKLHKKSTAESQKYKKEIQSAIRYISANYMRNISLSDIADELCISPNYLCNLFKQDTG